MPDILYDRKIKSSAYSGYSLLLMKVLSPVLSPRRIGGGKRCFPPRTPTTKSSHLSIMLPHGLAVSGHQSHAQQPCVARVAWGAGTLDWNSAIRTCTERRARSVYTHTRVYQAVCSGTARSCNKKSRRHCLLLFYDRRSSSVRLSLSTKISVG